MAACDGHVTGGAIERHGALVCLCGKNDRAAACGQSVSVEGNRLKTREIGGRTIKEERIFLQIDDIDAVWLVQTFDVRKRVGGVYECNRLAGAREAGLTTGEL